MQRPTRDSIIPAGLAERHRLRMLAHGRRKMSVGVHLSFLNADLVEFCGVLGFQWLFLDAEHTPVTHSNCRDLARAADVAGMFCLARVTRIDSIEIEGYLDAGVLGILAPRISSADEAREFVAAVKHPARKQRPGRWSRSAGFSSTDPTVAARTRSAAHANDPLSADLPLFTGVLIETREAIEHLDEILQVPGLDYFALGPTDLARSLARESSEDAQVRSMLDSARRRIHAAGRPQIVIATGQRTAAEEVAAGATLIAIPDTILLSEGGNRYRGELTL